MKAIITKKELEHIQKYWNQWGGFGGELESGCEYHSETANGKRRGVLTVYRQPGNTVDITFYHNSTIDEIKTRCEGVGVPWRGKQNIISINLGSEYTPRNGISQKDVRLLGFEKEHPNAYLYHGDLRASNKVYKAVYKLYMWEHRYTHVMKYPTLFAIYVED